MTRIKHLHTKEHKESFGRGREEVRNVALNSWSYRCFWYISTHQNYYFLISSKAPASIKLLKPASKGLSAQLQTATSEKHQRWRPRSHRNHSNMALPWLSFSWLPLTVVNDMHLRNIWSIHLNLSSPTTKVYQYTTETETKYDENLRREDLSVLYVSLETFHLILKKEEEHILSK